MHGFVSEARMSPMHRHAISSSSEHKELQLSTTWPLGGVGWSVAIQHVPVGGYPSGVFEHVIPLA